MVNPAAIVAQINHLQGLIAGYAATLRDPGASPQQKAQAQREIPQLELTIASLRAELAAAQATVADDAGVVPPPPKSAGQTVNDDAIDNPAKPPPLEADPATGRIRPRRENTEPSNADVPSTASTGDVDTNTNGPLKTFFTTQATLSNPEGLLPRLKFDPSTIDYPDTTVDFGIRRPGSNSGLGAFTGARAPETTGVGSSDDNPSPNPTVTATETNNKYNNTLPIQPQPNALDQFGSYTYSVSIYLMRPEQYKILVQSKTKSVIGYNLLIQSAGAPVTSGAGGASGPDIGGSSGENVFNPGSSGRNPYFGEDFYIDAVTVETNFPGGGTRMAHSASALKMTIIEPNGITFLDRLYKAVQDFVPKDGAGAINYTAVQYLMVIRWYGWDLNGELLKNPGGGPVLSDPNSAFEKFIPFTIRKINWGVSNKLVTYELDCAPIGQTLGASTGRGTIPYDVELSDGTVKGLLSGDAQYSGGDPGATSNSSTTTTTPAPDKANAAPSNKTVIRQGLMGAMNDFQKKLVAEGVYEVADEYEIVFANGAEVIANASVTKPDNIVKNLSATPMAPPATKSPSGADPKKTSVDNTVRNFAITAGQQIMQILDLVIRNSTYITNQARVAEQEETEIVEDAAGNIYEVPKNTPPTAKILWHNITMDAVPIKYDKKRNDYAYKISYIVSTYVAPNFDSKYFPVPQFNGIHKSYKYWWTGENIDVLDYQVTFNHLYNQTVSGSEPGNSATDRIRQQRSSSMRDIPKYVYQARSTESSAGAKSSGNEIAANASEYLYSPNDLAQAKVRIIGDPAWIMQGSMAEGVNAKNFNYSGFLPDGTINFDSQQVLFEIAWQRPQDYSLATGLADPYANVGGLREPIQSNIYHARKCISEFRQGKFEQTIEGALYSWPIPSGQNTPATRPVSVNVNSSGVSDRAAGTEVTTPAQLAIPGNGATAAPNTSDTVNLQSTATNANNQTTSDGLSRQENSVPDSNGQAVGVNLPAPPTLNTPNTTTQPTQLINSSA
jgi:hypothetical protein